MGIAEIALLTIGAFVATTVVVTLFLLVFRRNK